MTSVTEHGNQPTYWRACGSCKRTSRKNPSLGYFAIVMPGRTPRVLSALRPAVPIFVATGDDALARRLTLHRGVRPVVLPHGPHFGATLDAVEDRLIASGWLPSGAVIVFVSIAPDLAVSHANLLGIRRLGERSSR